MKGCILAAVALSLLVSATPAVTGGHADRSSSKPAAAHRDGEAVDAVVSFLASLDPEQRGRATFALDSDERGRWRRTPGERTGIGVADLDDGQRSGAHRMLRSVLSTQGYLKAVGIMLNEDIQGRVEAGLGPERYWIAVYGEPSPTEEWSWRIEGHHLSMHFSFVGERLVSASPTIYGMHPAHIRSEGARSGLKVLAGEEELARRLAGSLRDAGSAVAFGQGEAPSTLYAEAIEWVAPTEGMQVRDMSEAQQGMIRRLVAEYVGNYDSGYAQTVLDRLAIADLRFVWYGGLDAGDGHYYRLQGDDFVIEYQHYGGGASHIHCLWRELSSEH